ncbi:hypothetical protein BOTBODRAFT_32576 [Botryobasidium botryosum FD-172 SS1]|uniref:WD repeat-containing protein 75 second beta-propeller domain-containing protein n=1 Tax=Botryobasidium botryosum (strain FD-172 SS1) TaxID=930990 RepID=A0A067MF96_BOTB1|nr:hypothetical protein BOTBODRAFT_32576 [Botryobasidium botryosum FD-172 SS1]
MATVKSAPAQLTPELPAPAPRKPGKRRNRKGAAGAARDDKEAKLAPESSQISMHEKSGRPSDAKSWSWVALTEPDVSRHPAVFTRDSKYFFVAASTSVKIYSAVTGKIVSTLSLSAATSTADPSKKGGHTDLITSIVLNPHNPFQLFTASLDGCIKVWDYVDGVLLRTIDVGKPLSYMCAGAKVKDAVFVAAKLPDKKSKSGTMHTDQAEILRIELSPKSFTPYQKAKSSRVGKTRGTAGLAISPSGTYLVCTAGVKAYVALISNLGQGFTKFAGPEPITCLAFHPSEDYFATGDEKGVIRLWYCLDPQQLTWDKAGVEKKAPSTTLHWHAHAVSSLAFTPNGAYLLSGGEEAVLVVWQLQSGHKEFIPRVGAPISSISICAGGDERQQEYLLGLADGTLTFISAGTLKISRSISRVKIDPTLSSTVPITDSYLPLAVHPFNSHLVLPSSHPSSLQIFSPQTSTLVSELEVSPSNRVSRRDEKPIEPARIVHTALCPGRSTPNGRNGEWMATVDVREGSYEFSAEIVLKIWRWEKSRNWSYVLNTRIDRPHGRSKVTSVSFNPASKDAASCLLVTTGEDGSIKMWRIKSISNKKGQEEVFWAPRSTFSYRSQVPTQATWSPDGSLLAVAQGASVTLWDPQSNAMRHVLTCSEVPSVTQVAFVGKAGRYVVVNGEAGIAMWDLVSSAVLWHRPAWGVHPHIVAHPQSESFALVQPQQISKSGHSTRTTISVFGPHSSHTIATQSLPFGIRQSAWFPSATSPSGYSFVGITHQWAVMLIGDDVQRPDEVGPSGVRDDSAEPKRRTLLQDIFGQSAFAELENRSPALPPPIDVREAATGSMFNLQVFDGPAHLLPPLATLFSPLMDGVLKKPDKPDAHVHTDQMDVVGEEEDVVMEGVVVGTPGVERVVDQAEMDSFTELFSQMLGGSEDTASSSAQHANGKGTHKPAPLSNGHPPTHAPVNGTPKTPKLKSSMVAENPSTPDTPSIHMSTVGRKRKKSSG